MIWTWTGALAVIYEIWAREKKRPLISDLAHEFPYDLFIWAWLGTLAGHFILEWRRGRPR